MNGQHPLSANKSGCLSVEADVLLRAIPAFVAQRGEGSPRLVTFTPSADRAPLNAGHGC